MSENLQRLQLGGWHHFEELRLHTGWLYLCQIVRLWSISTVKQYGFCDRFPGLASWKYNNLRLRAVATIQTETLWHQTASFLIRHTVRTGWEERHSCINRLSVRGVSGESLAGVMAFSPAIKERFRRHYGRHYGHPPKRKVINQRPMDGRHP